MKRLGRGNLPFTHTQSKREKKGRALRGKRGKAKAEAARPTDLDLLKEAFLAPNDMVV